jgi:opine dehydrogenase
MSEIRRVAVLGAGNGGCAASAILTLKGYEVRMHSRSEERLAPLMGGITLGGEYRGVVKIDLVTTDLRTVVSGADLVMMVVPSVAHAGYARALAPILNPSQVVYLNPGHTGGALHFATVLREAGGPSPPLCESSTLTYICRMEEEAKVCVYRETTNLRFAALPARITEELAELLQPLFPTLRQAANVLETGFMNINAVIHPPGMLMNAGWIEFTKGNALFYKESITPAVARVIEEIDIERLTICESVGLQVPAFIDYFYEAGLTTEVGRQSRSVYQAMQESRPNRTIRSPSSLNHRYLHEDVGYGLVPMSEFGRLVGVPTSAMDSLITLASIAQNRDYRREGLTLSQMGLEGLSPEELLSFVE